MVARAGIVKVVFVYLLEYVDNWRPHFRQIWRELQKGVFEILKSNFAFLGLLNVK